MALEQTNNTKPKPQEVCLMGAHELWLCRLFLYLLKSDARFAALIFHPLALGIWHSFTVISLALPIAVSYTSRWQMHYQKTLSRYFPPPLGTQESFHAPLKFGRFLRYAWLFPLSFIAHCL